MNTLTPEHDHEIHGYDLGCSAVSREVSAVYAPASVSKHEVEAYGFKGVQRRSGLLLPFQDVHGKEHYQLKPDSPRQNRNGKPIKYETPRGARPVLAMSPMSRKYLGNPKYTLWITEGIKKIMSAESHGVDCIISIQGVYNWRGKNDAEGTIALPDWEYVALNDRLVVLAFDNDVITKRGVQKALTRIKKFLEDRGANVKVLVLPDLPDGSKCGLDDYFAVGGSS